MTDIKQVIEKGDVGSKYIKNNHKHIQIGVSVFCQSFSQFHQPNHPTKTRGFSHIKSVVSSSAPDAVLVGKHPAKTPSTVFVPVIARNSKANRSRWFNVSVDL